jgi:hypothetical protein
LSGSLDDIRDIDVIADPASAATAQDPARASLLAKLRKPASASALARDWQLHIPLPSEVRPASGINMGKELLKLLVSLEYPVLRHLIDGLDRTNALAASEFIKRNGPWAAEPAHCSHVR